MERDSYIKWHNKRVELFTRNDQNNLEKARNLYRDGKKSLKKVDIKKVEQLKTKLKGLNMTNYDEMVDILKTTNVSMFITEFGSCLLENLLKTNNESEIYLIIDFYYEIHSRFEDDNFISVLVKNVQDMYDEEMEINKKCNILYFLGLLSFCGFVPYKFIMQPFAKLFNKPTDNEILLMCKILSNFSYEIFKVVPSFIDNNNNGLIENKIKINPTKIEELLKVIVKLQSNYFELYSSNHMEYMKACKLYRKEMAYNNSVKPTTEILHKTTKEREEFYINFLSVLKDNLNIDFEVLPDVMEIEPTQEITIEVGDDSSFIEMINASGYKDRTEYFFYTKLLDCSVYNKPNDNNTVASQDLWLSFDQLRSQDDVDNWCKEFCAQNSRNNRKKLIDNVKNVPNINSQLLCPLYSRLIANLRSVVQNLLPELIEFLKIKLHTDFSNINYYQDNLLYLTYLSEFAKFKFMPPSAVISVAYRCVKKANKSKVDAAYHLLNNCAYFLRVNRDIQDYLNPFIKKLIKTSDNWKRHDPQISHVLKNCYYCFYPEKKPVMNQIQEPPIIRYIRYLINCINDENIDNIIDEFRAFDYNDLEILYSFETVLFKSVIASSITTDIANILAILEEYQYTFINKLKDNLTEHILLDIEEPNNISNQIKCCHIRLFTYLFGYRLIAKNDFFAVAYFLIGNGHYYNDTTAIDFNVPEYWALPFSPLIPTLNDLPIDNVRILLICEMLNVLCEYDLTEDVEEKNSLNIFLLIFQYYYYNKQLMILDIEFRYLDVMQYYKDVYDVYSNLEDVTKAIISNADLIKKYYVSCFGYIVNPAPSACFTNKSKKKERNLEIQKKKEENDKILKEFNDNVRNEVKTDITNRSQNIDNLNIPLNIKSNLNLLDNNSLTLVTKREGKIKLIPLYLPDSGELLEKNKMKLMEDKMKEKVATMRLFLDTSDGDDDNTIQTINLNEEEGGYFDDNYNGDEGEKGDGDDDYQYN